MPGDVVSARRTFVLPQLAAVAATFSVVLFSGCAQEKDEESAAAALTPVHALQVEGNGVHLAANGHLLALSARSKGIFVYETAAPERPVAIGFIELPSVYRAMIQGTTVLGFDERQGLSLADARNLDQLRLTQALSSVELYGQVSAALWNRSDLLLGNESVGLSHYKIGAGLNLVNADPRLQIPGNPAAPVAHLAQLGDGRIAAASFAGEFSLYRWMTSQSEQKVQLSGVFPAAHPVSGLACAASTCYAAALSDGLVVYDVPNDGKPQERTRLELPRTVKAVHLDAELLLLSYLGQRTNNGWYVLKLDAQGVPTVVRDVHTTAEVKDFATVGRYIYVLLADGQLLVYERGQFF